MLDPFPPISSVDLPPDALSFETTEDMAPLEGFVGQDAAIEALRFGIECAAPEQNVFVRGRPAPAG